MDLWNDPPPPSCSVSELLLGEVDSSTLLAVPPGDPSQVSSQPLSSGSRCLWEEVAISHGVGTCSQLFDCISWAMWPSVKSYRGYSS